MKPIRFLLALALAPALAFSQAANDLSVQQVNSGGTSFTEHLVPLQSQVSTTLSSLLSAYGLGIEDEVQFMGYKGNSQTVSYAASTAINMTQNLQTVTLAGNITFTTTNKAAGQYVTVRVIGDGSNRTLTFPSWKFVGTTAPTTLVASKVAILTLVCFGTNDTDIVASWVSEP